MFAGAHDAQPAVAGGSAPIRHLDHLVAGQVLAGQALLGLEEALDRTGVDHFAAVFPSARAHIDHVVGRADRVLVVLDHDHRVAQAPKPFQRLDQPMVVALMQADRRFVQHVQHTDQAGTDLAGEADALGLAPGQRGRPPVQVEVVEADVHQEAKARVDLLEHTFGDQQLPVVQLHHRQAIGCVRDRHRRQVVHVQAVQRDRQRQRVQPGTVTVRAGNLAHVTLGLLPRPVAVRLAVSPPQIRDGPFKVRLVAASAPITVLELHLHLLGGAVQQRFASLGGQILPRRVQVDVALLAHRFQQPVEELGVSGCPRGDRSLGHRQLGVGHHQVGIHLKHRAQPVTVLARAVGRVEREVARREFLEALAVGGTRQLLGERQRFRFAVLGHQFDHGQALGKPQRGLHRVGEATLDAVAQHQAVDDDVNVMDLVASQAVVDAQRHQVGQFLDLAVHPHPHEAFLGQVGEELFIGALASPNHRCQHLKSGALLQGQNPVDDLLGRLTHQFLAGLRVVRHAHAGKQQPQVVVDLGDRADRGARVA